jgi:hypothetical protein
MTRKELIKTYTIIAIGLVLAFICFYKACDRKDWQRIDSKEAIIAEYQKQMLKEKHDTLTTREYIYLDRWHDAKVITKEVIKEVYRDAPDTCDPYIKKVENAYQIEQKAAQMVHSSDSMIIQNLNDIIKVDSVLIAKSKQDLKLTKDTLSDLRKPKPLKKFINNAKHVVYGVLTGAAIVEVINVLK